MIIEMINWIQVLIEEDWVAWNNFGKERGVVWAWKGSDLEVDLLLYLKIKQDQFKASFG